jgi:tripartite-type tricarboxylate transporter receptor subunit TctC
VIDTINGKLQIDRGAMRGLAVTLPQREPRLAMVPSAAEAGLPDFQIWTWTGFYAPKGTPGELVARLNRDIVAACQDRQVLARLDTMGSTPSTTTPEEFAAFTRSEMTRWGDIIRRGNIKLE